MADSFLATKYRTLEADGSFARWRPRKIWSEVIRQDLGEKTARL